MEVLYLLVPLAVLIAGLIAALFFWSIKSGQFDDLEGPAHRILMDDEPPGQRSDGTPSGREPADPPGTPARK
jgi:cbb3-type cytochrome oxidase maturation protein